MTLHDKHDVDYERCAEAEDMPTACLALLSAILQAKGYEDA